jgi:ornithine cyclodeaminase
MMMTDRAMLFIPESVSAALVSHEMAFAAAREALIAACEEGCLTSPA